MLLAFMGIGGGEISLQSFLKGDPFLAHLKLTERKEGSLENEGKKETIN